MPCTIDNTQGGSALRKCTSVWFIAAGVLLTASTAYAADGELRWGDFGWRVLNLVVFVAILWKFAGKIIVNFLTGRREGIRQELDDLEAGRVSARQKLAEIEEGIANLENERKAILDESRDQAEAAKQAIIQEAHRQAEQILEQARRTAENEGRAVLAHVRESIAEEIIDAATAVLESKLDAAKHDKLINNSLTKVVLN